MSTDEEKKQTNMLRQGVDDDWDKTIVAFERPYRLRDLLSEARGQNQGESTTAGLSFKIQMASTGQRRTQANRLIQKKFSWIGSTAESGFKENSNRITLAIDQGNITIGTVTLCFDTPPGLDVDETYKAEVDQLRVNGKKLVEITNFAAEGAFNNKRLMAAIVHVAYIYARHIHRYTDFVIEVKARHSRYYEKMLEFKRCGPEKLCSWASEPAVLLCLDLDYMGKQIEKFGGAFPLPPNEKRLYPYFFSKQDEIGITNRLMQS